MYPRFAYSQCSPTIEYGYWYIVIPHEIALFEYQLKDYNRTSLFTARLCDMSSSNSSRRRAFRSQVAQLDHKVLQARIYLIQPANRSQQQSTNLDLLGFKTAPVSFFFDIMLNAFENITDKITVVHAKEVCKFRGLPPTSLE